MGSLRLRGTMTSVKSTGAGMTVINLHVVTTLLAATTIEAQSQLRPPSSKTVRGEVSLFHWRK